MCNIKYIYYHISILQNYNKLYIHTYGGFLKWGYPLPPKSFIYRWIFHYKP